MSTLFTPHLDQQIIPEQNLIYCSTFQLAWNELSEFMNGEVTLKNPAITTARAVQTLNKKEFTKTLLDENSYIALADLVGNGIVEKIVKDLRERFQEKTKFDFSGLDPSDILAYSFLLKVLAFEQKFDEIQTLEFNGTPVQAFGTKVRRDSPHKLLSQIRILHYKDDNEFTICLKTKSNQIDSDYIILAMLEPRDTFKETLDAVNMGTPGDEIGHRIRERERLEIPKIFFDQIQGFNELCGRKILIDGKESEYFIAQALQAIKFELNEEGAKLRSEAVISARKCCMSFEEKPRNFIFDKPFLVCLKQKESDPPYFVAWIENTDVLKKKA